MEGNGAPLHGLLLLLVALFSSAPVCLGSGVSGSVPTGVPELVGHLKPFGFQRPAEYPIDEVIDPYSLTPEQFYTQYVEAVRPVVFRGAAKHFKAYSEWTKPRLMSQYGKLELRIEPRKDGSAKHPVGALGFGRDTMENFVRGLETSDNYVVSELPSPMYGDVELLPCMSCGRLLRKVSEVNLWMSGGGTRSRLHRDAFNAINCQINGTKDWIMIPANQTDNVYFKASSDWELGGLSPVNTDSIDLKKYPRIRDVPWGITTVEAGDCIYVPGGHYHQVRSYGLVNVAVSVLFSRLESPHALGFDPAECRGLEPRFVPLSETPEILWAYPGHGMMTMGCIDDNAMVSMIFSMSDGKPVSKKQFFAQENTPFDQGDGGKAVKKIWKLLDTNQDGLISRSDIGNISRDDWRKMSHIMEPDVVFSNSYDYEYAVLDYTMVRTVLSRALQKQGKMSREDFTSVYTEVIRGSDYYANKLFDQLDKAKKGAITWKKVKKGLLEEVLEPFLMSEEEDGGNHFADGDGDDVAGEEEALDGADLMRSVMGRDEGDIEGDESLSDSEREMALEEYQERASHVSDILGLDQDSEADTDSDNEGGEEEEEDGDDEDDPENARLQELYRTHMEKVERESHEQDRLPEATEELEEIMPAQGDAAETSRKAKTEL
eukprot:scpid40626/ scgid25973/ JmjC domain-containing protein 7; Jumonji domain-containing protein 7